MVGFCLLLWLTLFAAGDTPVGRGMRHWLVDWPAARLARIERGAATAWLILGAIGAVCFWLLGQEGLRLYTMAMPEIAGWIVMFEVASYVDAIAVAVMVASSVRLATVRAWLAQRLPMRRAARARRSRRVRAVERAANDDEDRAGVPLAA